MPSCCCASQELTSAMACLPPLVACCLVLCLSQGFSNAEEAVISPPAYQYNSRSSSSSDDNHLTDPGVIIGIVVGIVGVLVVLGVSILLCRLFCCKNASCCKCFKAEEKYRDLSSSSKMAKPAASRQEEQEISIILQNHHLHSRQGEPEKDSLPHDPPEYDDLPESDWKTSVVNHSSPEAEKKADPHLEELSHAPYSGMLRQNGVPKPEARPKKRKKFAGKTHGLDVSTSEQNLGADESYAGKDTDKDDYPKYDPAYQNSNFRPEEEPNTDSVERDLNGRDYQSYGYEPQRRHHNPLSPATRADYLGGTTYRSGGEMDSRPQVLGPQQDHVEDWSKRWRGPDVDRPEVQSNWRHVEDLPYQDDRMRMYDRGKRDRSYGTRDYGAKERGVRDYGSRVHGARDYGGITAPAAHRSHSQRLAPPRLNVGADNHAFNQSSAETEV